MRDEVFNQPLHRVWQAALETGRALSWEVKDEDRSSGILRFRRSYVYASLDGQEARRVPWLSSLPRETGNLRPYLFAYASSRDYLFGRPLFTSEELEMRVVPLGRLSARVLVRHSLELHTSWMTQALASSGQLEHEILRGIRLRLP